ncbi:hypothetical protein LG311_01780 [Sutcliffiella horikoshii]|uniref:reverse transcriptase domain-containing protein n=1 Tax=Sutcliffiella horikoshii TaxID=79883 RepID=UPI00384C46C8
MKEAEWYTVKYIKKKNKLRKIITYKDDTMREKHKKVNEVLNKTLLYSKFSKAYIKGTSIFENAKAHMFNDTFLKLDIKDFFNSINHKVLLRILYYEMNKKFENKIVYDKNTCEKLIKNCSISNSGVPLGLITSPALANIYLKEFDNILYGKLKMLSLENVIYTRYADDLTISFKSNPNDKEIIRLIEQQVVTLLKRYNLKLNEKKTKYVSLDKSNHVRVTGLSIIKDANNYRRISIGRKQINELFYNAIDCFKIYNSHGIISSSYEVKKIKGLESFILSIEKTGYDNRFSNGMKEEIKKLGFANLSELIKSLPDSAN